MPDPSTETPPDSPPPDLSATAPDPDPDLSPPTKVDAGPPVETVDDFDARAERSFGLDGTSAEHADDVLRSVLARQTGNEGATNVDDIRDQAYAIINGERKDAGLGPADYLKALEDRLESMNQGRLVSGPLDQRRNVHRDADPVEMFTGQLVVDANDATLCGAGIEFAFQRTYKSRSTYSGPLGSRWDHSYNLWIWEKSPTLLLRSNGSLREEEFIRHPRFGEVGFTYYSGPNGTSLLLTPNGSSFDCTAAGGQRWRYEMDPTRPGFHRVARVEDRFGNYIALGYDADGRLDSAEVNHPDRTVRFHYGQDQRLEQTADHVGRTWTYQYDDFGDLVFVTSPSTKRFPLGATTRYEYSTATHPDGALSHNLLRIVGPDGATFVESAYGDSPGLLSYGRVVRQRSGKGEYLLEYESMFGAFDREYSDEDRPSVQVNFYDRNGHPIHFIYNRFGNLLLREERVATPGGDTLARWRYRYNRDGSLCASLSPEGAIAQYAYGRELFCRAHGELPEDGTPHPDLTASLRARFTALTAVVRRASRYTSEQLDVSLGIWGDVFPDIFGLLGPDDVVQKLSYEPTFTLLESVSHPRFTASADPAHPESLAFEAAMTRLTYTTPSGGTGLLLSQVTSPTPSWPDGTAAGPVLTTFESYDNRGRCLRRVDPSGVAVSFEYYRATDGFALDGHARRMIVDPEGRALTTTFEVDALGRVIAVHSPNAVGAPAGHHITRYSYDAHDNLTELVSSPPFSFVTRFFHDEADRLERTERDAVDEDGVPIEGGLEIRTYRYDQQSNLLESSDGGSDLDRHRRTHFTYDPSDRLVEVLLPNRSRISARWDERHNQSAVTMGADTADASTRQLRYTLDGHLRRRITARGFASDDSTDPLGRLVERRDPLGNVHRRTFDKSGNLLVERVFERREDGSHALVYRAENEYDVLNRCIRASRNLFDVPIAAIDVDNDHLASPGPGRLVSERRYYDGGGRILRREDALGRSWTHRYGVFSTPDEILSPAGDRQVFTHDPAGNLIEKVTFDVASPPGAAPQQVFVSRYRYDQLDRLIRVEDSLGNVTTLHYDSRDNLTAVVDPLGNRTRRELDLHARTLAAVRERTANGLGSGAPVPAVRDTVEYDANDNPISCTDALGRLTTWRLDSLGRIREEKIPDGSISSISYDADSNPIRSVDENGVVREATFDALGRLTQQSFDLTAASQPVEGAVIESFGYDPLGRMRWAENDLALCSQARNSLGWLISETTTMKSSLTPDETPLTLGYHRDDVGNVVEITYPTGRVVRLIRQDGLIAEIVNGLRGDLYPGGSTPDTFSIAEYEYVGRRVITSRLGNATETRHAYDGAGRLIESRHEGPAMSLTSLQELRDGSGNVRIQEENEIGRRRAEYDSLYRLTRHAVVPSETALPIASFAPSIDHPPPAPPVRQSDIDAAIGSLAQSTEASWSYDLVGNRTADTSAGGGRLWVANALDQYVAVGDESPEYDPSGNLIADARARYFYDPHNRLVRAVDRITGVDLVRFGYDALSRRIAAIDDRLHRFVFDGERPVSEYLDGGPSWQVVRADGRLVHLATDGTDSWCHLDGLGSIRVLSDPTGGLAGSSRYDPFGVPIAASGPNHPFGFAGEIYDETLGVYVLGRRILRADWGRFLQRDPTGMVDGSNRYTYAGNDPFGHVDPRGLAREQIAAGYCEPLDWCAPNPEDTPPPHARSDWTTSRVVKGMDTARKSVGIFSNGSAQGFSAISNKLVEAQAPKLIVRATQSAQNLFVKGVAQLASVVKSAKFRWTAGGISFIDGVIDAYGRGVDPFIVAVDGTLNGLLTVHWSRMGVLGEGARRFSSAVNLVDAGINIVAGVVALVSPRAAPYAKMVTSVTPSQTVKQVTFAIIDNFDADFRGDYALRAALHEIRLHGKYGEVVRGYAIASEAINVWEDIHARGELEDAVASGALGPLPALGARIGDWLATKR